jgi:Raf kinase inhibitor-like YbhB/YbcL family protein
MWIQGANVKFHHWLYAALVITLLAGCGHPSSHNATLIPQPTKETVVEGTETLMPTETLAPFALTSPAFKQGGSILRDLACTGDNLSPQLDWTEPPAGTQSFALIFNDPDASSKGFVHWIVYNIPGDARKLPGAVPAGPVIHDSAVHGSNGWGRMDYGGPCPPEGSTHNYVFTLYALDSILDLESGVTKDELLAAMMTHILAEVELSAFFTR